MICAAAASTVLGTLYSNSLASAHANEVAPAARAAPGGQDAIVNVSPVRDQIARIREALPPTTDGSPSTRFTPQGLSRFLLGVDDIAENVTIEQARQMRSLIIDAIDDKTLMPGVPERYLNQLNQAISRSIDDSVARAGTPELRQALSTANRYYAQNIDRFSRKGSPRPIASRSSRAMSRIISWSNGCFPAVAIPALFARPAT